MLDTCGLAISTSSNSSDGKYFAETRSGRVTYGTRENKRGWIFQKLTGFILEGKRCAPAGRAAQESHQQQPPGQLGRSPQHHLKRRRKRIRLAADRGFLIRRMIREHIRTVILFQHHKNIATISPLEELRLRKYVYYLERNRDRRYAEDRKWFERPRCAGLILVY